MNQHRSVGLSENFGANVYGEVRSDTKERAVDDAMVQSAQREPVRHDLSLSQASCASASRAARATFSRPFDRFEEEGRIKSRKEGRSVFYRLADIE